MSLLPEPAALVPEVQREARPTRTDGPRSIGDGSLRMTIVMIVVLFTRAIVRTSFDLASVFYTHNQ